MRSSRSFETLTVRASWVMNPLYGRDFWLSGARRSGFVSQRRARAREVRMDCQRGVKGEARLERRARAQQDFAKMHHGGEMPGLELERAADVLQALQVAPEEVVEGRALVPGLGEIGRPAQELGEAGFGDVVAPRGDVAGGEVEDPGGHGVGVVHPHAPDLVL